jgi:hypothetical protein
MKHFLARLTGALAIGAALAACSGNQAVTPATATAPVPGARQAAARVTHPAVVRITQADRAFGRRLTFLPPHVTYPKFHNPYLHVARPSAVGYPLDMTCQTKACPVMSSSTAYDIYVSMDGKTCLTEACWGTPEEFLKGLAGSALAGLATQYTNGPASGYTFGGSMAVKYTSIKYDYYAPTFYQNDLGTILAAAVRKIGATGLNAEYHIFLPPGADTCFDQSASCYSPDHLAAFAFCAYHSAALIPGSNTPIVFSVEPWQNAKVRVKGKMLYACQNSFVPKGTNRLNSGTASTLSHESFESWSDPLPNSGWFNSHYGMEIGDVCAYTFMFTDMLGGSNYYLQQEYSNAVHGCNSQ